MASETVYGRSHPEAMAAGACFASAELRRIAAGTAGYGYFCRLLAASGAINGCPKAQVDSFDGSGCGAINVPGAPGFRNRGHEPERHLFRSDGRAHHGVAAGAGAQFS